jgi:4-methylaminobutanoate oxidase (formaldehyde-forming)
VVNSLPTQAQVVIIGGGIIGCSVAYHLVERGLRDVVLLERKSLTCGTTWHAAGLVAQLRATRNLTRLAQYSAQLYARLEAETGQATGFERTGSLTVASDYERLEELQRSASMARHFGIEVDALQPDEIAARWPLIRANDLVGGVYLPGDAQTGPVDTTIALANGARAGGARIFENTRVTGIETRDGKLRGVQTERGPIAAEFVVNAGGLWAREIGQMCGVNVPLHAAEHFYVITEPVAGLALPLPTLRDPGSCLYFKAEAGGKLLIGFFEPVAKPWGADGIPSDFAFDLLPEDWTHLEPQLEAALHRVPELANTGIRQFVNGPESFTPDDRYLLGEAPELSNFFVAAGFNSIGIQSAGGAGKVLADWIVDGSAPMDLWDVDPRRLQPFTGEAGYLRERTVETLGLLYAMHWPYRQFESARGIRLSPLHERLERAGACFGELAGWERANWFAPSGVEPTYRYSWGRQNWFDYSAREHFAVRNGVGLFDQTSFAKFLVRGPDAAHELERICAGRVSVAPGRIVYTQWLNPRGGIEADLTVTRLDAESFLVVSGAATQLRDFCWLRDGIAQEARVSIADVTGDFAVLGLMGPKSRELLERISATELSDRAFPFATSREIEIAGVKVRASRITYVGELGWELYVANSDAGDLHDALVTAGADLGLVHAGFHALDSLRIEKAYRHWGHDVGPDDTPLEAGLGFAVAFDKPGGFVGRDALLAQRSAGPARRLLQFALLDPEPLLYHDEPIWRDDRPVGQITSGSYGHTLGRAVGLGYVDCEPGAQAAALCDGRYQIEIAGVRWDAQPSARPLYDPASSRVRGSALGRVE